MKKTYILFFVILLTKIYIPTRALYLNAENIKVNRVLGRIKKPNFLSDNDINKNNFAEFEFLKERNTYFIVELENAKYIKKIKLYFIENYYPSGIRFEFSQNLFDWETIAENDDFQNYGNNIVFLDTDTHTRAAKFIKIVIEDSAAEKIIKISELDIESDKKLKLKSAKLELINVGEYNLKLKLVSDIESVCFIKYGQSLNNLIDGPVILEYNRENVFNITGLLKGTEYYVVGIARDCNDNTLYTKPLEVKTAGIPLPLIKKIAVNEITDSTISVYFQCNIETRYNIYFGYSVKNLKKGNYKKFSDTHNFVLKNLKPETIVYYRIEIIDKFGNKHKSEILSSKTLPESITHQAIISGDFNFIGESLGPNYSKDSSKRLADGDYSYINGSVMSGNIFAHDQVLKFDLKKSVQIERIDFIWWALIYSSDFELQISADNKKWDIVAKKVEPDKNIRYDFELKIPYVVSRVYINKKIQYIKAIFKKGKCVRKFPQYSNLRLLEVFIIPQKKYSEKIVPVLIK